MDPNRPSVPQHQPPHQPQPPYPGYPDPWGDGFAEGELDLGEYLNILRRRWKVIAAVAAVFLAAALAHFAITPKQYKATTTLLIERHSPAKLASAGQDPWQAGLRDWEFYPTQYELLKSRGIAERVVENLRLAEDPDFNPPRAGAGNGASPERDRAELGRLASRLQRGIEVRPVRDTQLVEISYRSLSPELSARVANGVAEAYIDWGIETRTETAGLATTFLASQIEQLKQEIQDKEAELQAYGRTADIVTMDSQANPALRRLESLNRDYIDALSDRIEKQARFNELTAAPREVMADSLSGGLVSQLRGEILQLEREYETKLNTYRPEWPAMVDLRGQIERSKESLEQLVDETISTARDRARAEFQTAQRRERALAEELERAKDEALELSGAAVHYNNLQVEVTTRRTLLDELVRRQSDTEVVTRLTETRDSNARVVDRALPPRGPFRPSLPRSVSLGLFLGLFFGVGGVFALNYLDRTLRDPDQVERALGIPTLTVVPDLDEMTKGYGYTVRTRTSRGERLRERLGGVGRRVTTADLDIELVPHTRPRLAVSEAYRSLRTALLLSTADELKMVTVTSTWPEEGKTATAVNLATVLSQLGYKTLLLEADLRKPRLHQVFDLSNRTGLVNVLTGRATLEETIQRTKLPNLALLASGPIPPNPSELLASKRMRAVADQLRNDFEFIVVDTPPALSVTDATLMGVLSDGVVLCLEAQKIDRKDAEACLHRLQLAGVRILGAVLNRFRPESAGYSYSRRYTLYYQGEEPEESSSRGSAA